MQEHGPHLAALLRERQADRADLEMLRHQTERRMRLRRLVFDPSVPDAHLKACCVRLSKASPPPPFFILSPVIYVNLGVVCSSHSTGIAAEESNLSRPFDRSSNVLGMSTPL